MSDKSWKQFERRIAKRLDGRRVGILGKEDIEHPLFSIECKLLKELPKGLTEPYKQAEKNCPAGKIAIVCMKEKKKQDGNALIIMSFESLLWMVEDMDEFNSQSTR